MSKQSRDRAAYVLILINQYELVLLPVPVRQFFFTVKNPDRKSDQVGEIDALSSVFFLLVQAKDSQELLGGLFTPVILGEIPLIERRRE